MGRGRHALLRLLEGSLHSDEPFNVFNPRQEGEPDRVVERVHRGDSPIETFEVAQRRRRVLLRLPSRPLFKLKVERKIVRGV